MGCPNKLTGDVLPTYPTNEEWPMITTAGVEVKALRFRWDKAYSEAANWKGIRWIMNEIHRNGPQYSPAAAQAIADISNEDLQTRVIWKFNELSKTLKNWNRLKEAEVAPVVVVISSSPEPEGVMESVGDDGPGQTATVVVPKQLSAGMKNSRAKGVSFLSLLQNKSL